MKIRILRGIVLRKPFDLSETTFDGPEPRF